MRIQFVINSNIVGGAEKHTFDLARSLAARGHDCGVHALTASAEAPPSFSLDRTSTGPATGFAAQVAALGEAVEGFGPDLLIAVNQRPLLAARLARLGRRRPRTGVIFHSTVLRNARERMWQRLYNPFFSGADLFYISQNQRRYWKARGLRSRREFTIHNGIDLEHFSPREPDPGLRAELGFGPDDYVIGCCAALRPEKNHPQLLHAIARLRERGVPARGLIVGEGWRRPALEALTAELGLEAAVSFVGLQSDVRPFVSLFDVGVICSTAIETLSLSALEVMAMGRPMVMSDIGGASEIVSDGVEGGLFSVGDDEGLVERLARLSSREACAAAGREARAKVERDFNGDVMVAAYEDAFGQLLKGA